MQWVEAVPFSCFVVVFCAASDAEQGGSFRLGASILSKYAGWDMYSAKYLRQFCEGILGGCAGQKLEGFVQKWWRIAKICVVNVNQHGARM